MTIIYIYNYKTYNFVSSTLLTDLYRYIIFDNETVVDYIE